NKVVRDDAAVAPPPHGFCAHDGAMPRASALSQRRQPTAKAFTHGVVGVIVEALILPERIDVGRHVARAAAQAAQRCNVLITDLECGKLRWQNILIVLWIGARAWHGANVSDQRHTGALQQAYKIRERAGGVADGVERLRHPFACPVLTAARS